MAAVLKTTANGTTTSPVKRGAFVMDKILGIVPTPPPPDAGGIEPGHARRHDDPRAVAKHKRNATCAGCHQKMDGYGFALESFDVVGEWRDRYRAIGAQGPEPHRNIVHGRRCRISLRPDGGLHRSNAGRPRFPRRERAASAARRRPTTAGQRFH